MFERIANFLRTRRQQRRRAIFRFFDGVRERRADPLVVLRALAADPRFLLDKHPALAAAGDAESQHITVAAVRSAFAVQAYSYTARDQRESGLTDEESLELLSRFAEFLEVVKKNGSPPPTSPAAMDLESSPPPTPAVDPAACPTTCPTNASSA